MAIPHFKVYKQEWIESERGWGQKYWGTTYHIDMKESVRYIKEYYAKHNNEDYAPDWYVRTNGETKECFVPQDVYEKVTKEKTIWAD